MNTTINAAPPSLRVPRPLFRRETEELQLNERESNLVDGEGTFGSPTPFASPRTDRQEPQPRGLLAAWIGMQLP